MSERLVSNPEVKENLSSIAFDIIVGTAIGDTLGMPVEGWTHSQIQKYLGGIREPMSCGEVQAITLNHPAFIIEDAPLKYMTREMKKGEWTDDTMLTVAVANGLKNGLSLYNVAEEHKNIFLKVKDIPVHQGGWGSFGGTTQRALENLMNGISPINSGVETPGPGGNAPALKSAPIGFYAWNNRQYSDGLDFAKSVGQMTHKDPRSVASGVIQAHAAYSLLNGISRKAFLPSCLDIAKKFDFSKKEGKKTTLVDRIQTVYDNRDADDYDVYKMIGNGFAVTQSYPFALFMFHKYWDDPVEGILRTASMGGDADSTAAIYGALAGARGVKFPFEWVESLQGLAELEDAALNLVQFS